MNTASLKPLFVTTLQNPRQAAEQVLAMHLPSQALWIALSLVSVVTSLITSLRVQAFPLSEAEIERLSETAQGRNALTQYALVAEAPVLLALFVWGLIVLMVFTLYWVGKLFGGKGSQADILAVFTLLQVVALIASFALSVLGLIVPSLAALGSLVLAVWSLWAVTMLLDVAHRFGNPLKSIGVLIASAFGVLVGTSVFIALIGGVAVSVSGVN